MSGFLSFSVELIACSFQSGDKIETKIGYVTLNRHLKVRGGEPFSSHTTLQGIYERLYFKLHRPLSAIPKAKENI